MKYGPLVGATSFCHRDCHYNEPIEMAVKNYKARATFHHRIVWLSRVNSLLPPHYKPVMASGANTPAQFHVIGVRNLVTYTYRRVKNAANGAFL